MHDVRCFRFWCQKVLPLVYDESLSYYEVLCKITDYINNMIKDDNQFIDDVETLKAEMKIVQEWIDNFDTSYLEGLVQEYITKVIKNVWFGISSGGYFMAVIPDGWEDIHFDTIQEGDLYGHLVLEYN